MLIQSWTVWKCVWLRPTHSLAFANGMMHTIQQTNSKCENWIAMHECCMSTQLRAHIHTLFVSICVFVNWVSECWVNILHTLAHTHTSTLTHACVHVDELCWKTNVRGMLCASGDFFLNNTNYYTQILLGAAIDFICTQCGMLTNFATSCDFKLHFNFWLQFKHLLPTTCQHHPSRN